MQVYTALSRKEEFCSSYKWMCELEHTVSYRERFTALSLEYFKLWLQRRMEPQIILSALSPDQP